jgi:hypothetical protein
MCLRFLWNKKCLNPLPHGLNRIASGESIWLAQRKVDYSTEEPMKVKIWKKL